MEHKEPEVSDYGYKQSSAWIYESRVPENICDLIVSEFRSGEPQLGKVGIKSVVDTSIRSVKTIEVPNTHWVNGIPMYFGFDANVYNFGYQVSNVAFTEFFSYEPGMFYGPHIDVNPQVNHPAHNRKLTVIIQLSDEKDYEGGDLNLYSGGLNPMTMTKKKGSVIVFNSSVIHEVKPLLSGTRYVLASWIIGPPFS